MAMRNDDHHLPSWVHLEMVHNPRAYQYDLRCWIQAHDADVALFNLGPILTVDSPGRSPRLMMTKRQVLESVLETVSKQLAVLALEDK